MKFRSPRFAIPNPCSEHWHEMSPEEKGRFCAKCEKVVRDFTRSDPVRILNEYIAQKGKVCGRVRSDQLRTPIIAPRMSFFRRFALACMMAFGTSLFSLDADALPVLNDMRNNLMDDDTSKTKIYLQGVVRSANHNEPLPYITVAVSFGEYRTGGVTSEDGTFSILIDKTQLEGLDSLEVTCFSAGYIRKSVRLPIDENLLKPIKISLESEWIELMGDIMIIDEPEPGEDAENARHERMDLDQDDW